MIPAAMIINSSGIPNASNPDNTDLKPVDKPDDKTRGIKSGVKNPAINMMVPQNSLFPGGFLASLILFLASDIIKTTSLLQGVELDILPSAFQ